MTLPPGENMECGRSNKAFLVVLKSFKGVVLEVTRFPQCAAAWISVKKRSCMQQRTVYSLRLRQILKKNKAVVVNDIPACCRSRGCIPNLV